MDWGTLGGTLLGAGIGYVASMRQHDRAEVLRRRALAGAFVPAYERIRAQLVQSQSGDYEVQDLGLDRHSDSLVPSLAQSAPQLLRLYLDLEDALAEHSRAARAVSDALYRLKDTARQLEFPEQSSYVFGPGCKYNSPADFLSALSDEVESRKPAHKAACTSAIAQTDKLLASLKKLSHEENRVLLIDADTP